MQAQIEPMQLGRQISATGGEIVDFVLAALLRLGIDDESVHHRRISFHDA